MARNKEVVAKRGCTCCGTGCVIPAAVVPLVSFGLSGMIGWAAAVVFALPAALGVVHLLGWAGRG